MIRSLLLTAAFLCAIPILAEDWPEFRGPTGQGLVRDADLPTEWGPRKNVVWKEAIPGQGWSSPVVVAGRVYLTTSVPASSDAASDQSLRALCLDAKLGKILWNVEVFKQEASTAPRIHKKNSHASPTPIVDGDRVYVHFGHQGTACLDLGGKVLWQNTSLKYRPVHGNGGSPVVVGDLLIFSCDGGDKPFVVALDKTTGKERWKTERGGNATKKFSFSTPLVIEVAGKQQLVSPGSDAVVAYDPATGKEIWRVRYEGYSVIPRPVYGHGLLFFSTGYDKPQLLAVRPGGSGDVTAKNIAWKMAKSAPHTPSALLVGDELYVVADAGVATCLDARTGEVHWQERLDGHYSASPVYAGGKVHFQSEEGVGTVVRASKKFEQLAKNDMEERTLASYAVADGALFLRTEKHLYRIESR